MGNLAIYSAMLMLAVTVLRAETLDVITFGQPLSERAHAVSVAVGTSEIRSGGRVLLPPKTGWSGSRLAFRVRVRPSGINYLTVRFPARETNRNLLFLFVGEKQLGYRPLGDYDVLCNANAEPIPLVHSFYQTLPLPESLTAGKTSLELGLGATGPIWPYGRTFDVYQGNCDTPSRTVLSLAVHTEPLAPARELGDPIQPPRTLPPVRTGGPGAEIAKSIQMRINQSLTAITKRRETSWRQMEIFLLARAYSIPWTSVYRAPSLPRRLALAIDAHYVRYHQTPAFLTTDTTTWNSDWYCFGVLGATASLLAPAFEPLLNEPISDGSGNCLPRRAAWDVLFTESLRHLRMHRRQYTNQAMISDLNLYRANRGLLALGSPHALSEAAARAYLYEACGLMPWLGSDDAAGERTSPLGDDFYQITPAGLTRELGYVGNYGEILNWMAEIVAATRQAADPSTGDPKLIAQFVRLARARAIFRYPSADAEGNRAMRLEVVTGWRDLKLQGDVIYGQRGGSLTSAAMTGDPALIGYAQQALADGQLYRPLADALKGGGLRANHDLLDFPLELEWLLKQPTAGPRLPMTAGEPDFVFVDLDDGIVAVKSGEERLYVSLYWRALYGVNRLGKVHYLAPGCDYRATVAEDVRFQDSGRIAKRPANTDAGYGQRPFHEYDSIRSAIEGEPLPIAEIPHDIPGSNKVGRGNLFAGRCELYHLNYGDYVFILNSGDRRSFDVALPAGAYRDLATGASASDSVTLRPRTSCVLKKVRK